MITLAAKPEADESVVERLEEMLERAKRGELVAVAVAGVLVGGSVATGWAGGGR